MPQLSTVRDIRSSLLIGVTDPLPVGARFVEARFHAPEGEWHPAIPGATLATLANGVLAGSPQPHTGRFPLPDADRLRATLDDWGLTIDTPVVVYSFEPGEAKTAARAWFVLRDAGLADVRILDGGIEGWRARQAQGSGRDAAGRDAAGRDAAGRAAAAATDAAGHAAAGGTDAADPHAAAATDAAGHDPARPTAPDLVPAQHPAPRPAVAIDAAQAAEAGRTGLLLDARPATAFAAGHIPGAASTPIADVFRDDYLLPADELADWATSLGAPDAGQVAAYCGGGVAAAGTVFALATLGIDAQLYVGSWSQWSRLPDHPVQN
nr:rhodanese-like domain-containing protein [Microbacterium bovistercoris]